MNPSLAEPHRDARECLSNVPRPAERRLALRVTPAAQHALRQGHPWLFDQSITDQSAEGRAGDLAVVFDDRRRFLAIGLYDPTSPLRVRVLQHRTPAAIDGAWFFDRLSTAAARRATLPETGTTGYRVVHGENDGLPGLVVDRYDTTLVLKIYTLAWIPHLSELCEALAKVVPARTLILRLSREVASRPDYLYGLAEGDLLGGEPVTEPVRFTENGLIFEADVLHGQKTGFFLDQRDNRARVETLAGGRRTLNVFAYTGGFSVAAARGGAPEVLSIDASAPALEAAEHNFALNRHVPAVAACRHRILVADAFAALAGMRERGERYDLVITDPPSFGKREAEIDSAVQAYGRLAALAIGVTAPGGLLLSASCTNRVDEDTFYAAVNRAAIRACRPLEELERTGHALDHPVGFPEGAYLKALIARVP